MPRSGWRTWLALHGPGRPVRVHGRGREGVEVSLHGEIRAREAPLIGYALARLLNDGPSQASIDLACAGELSATSAGMVFFPLVAAARLHGTTITIHHASPRPAPAPSSAKSAWTAMWSGATPPADRSQPDWPRARTRSGRAYRQAFCLPADERADTTTGQGGPSVGSSVARRKPSCQEPRMSHRPRTGRAGGFLRCPASALVVVGVILTITGAVLYTMPGERPGLVAAAALTLASSAPGGAAHGRADHNPAPM